MKFTGHRRAERPIDWLGTSCAGVILLCFFLAGMLTGLMLHQHRLYELLEAMK